MKCDAACSAVDKLIDSICGPPASQGGNPNAPVATADGQGNRLTFNNRSDCTSDMGPRYVGQLYLQCASRESAKDAEQGEMITMIAAGVAAAVCLVGCAYPAYATYCTVLSYADLAVELGVDIDLEIKAGNKADKYKKANQPYGGDGNFDGSGDARKSSFGLGVVLAAGAAVTSTVIQSGATSIGKEAAKKAAEEAAKKGGEEAGKKAGDEAGKKSSNRAAACSAAGIFAASLIIKGITYGVTQSNEGKACNNIEAMPDLQAQVVGLPTPPPGSSSGTVQNPSGNSLYNSQGGSTNPSSGGSSGSSGNPLNPPSSNTPSGAAASADPIFKELDKLGTKDKMPEVFQKLTGMSPDDFGRRIAAAGGNAAGVLAAAMPNGLGDGLAKLNEDVKNGDVAIKGLSESPAFAAASGGGAGGGSKGGGGGDELASLFGGGKGGGGGGNNVASFGGNGEDPNDIWHSKTKFSLFEIISHKLEKNLGRVDRLEWSTKLNQALTREPGGGK